MPSFRLRHRIVTSLSLLLLATCGGGSGGDAEPDYEALTSAGFRTMSLAPGADLEFRLVEAAIQAEPGTVIELPAGTFQMTSEVVVSTSHVTIKGQGMDRTILDFSGQQTGAQGILGTADVFTVEDLAVLDTPGDGIKVEGVDGVTFRRVRVEWTGGPNPLNGSYGVYPVHCTNVLIEDSVVRGASDAGIYVGQSERIVVRRNRAELNVAGIEIENSIDADVYENVATRNTGGILVFDLPNLDQFGERTRVHHNQVFENNTANFAPAGNIVGLVPAGTGIMVMANDDDEVFENEVLDNFTAGIAIISYLISGNSIDDPDYDPIPERVHVHHNVVDKSRDFFLAEGSDINLLVNVLFALNRTGQVADVLYDGIGERFFGGDGLGPDRGICVHDNVDRAGAESAFANLNLRARGNGQLPLPAGAILQDRTPHDCSYAPLERSRLDRPARIPAPMPRHSAEETAAACVAPAGGGVNWAAFDFDCPSLADYQLFANATDPTSSPNESGFAYELTTPLFSDYATKHRFLFVPPGDAARYREGDVLDLPVGTIIAKTFGFVDDLRAPSREDVIETRLLIHRESGWVGLPYVWDAARTSARLSLGGGAADVTFVGPDGNTVSSHYQVPNANQCTGCHASFAEQGASPIGPKARYLNRDNSYPEGAENQLARLARLGLLADAPAPEAAPRLPAFDDPADGTLEERARTYLEINCAHCHSQAGRARFSGLLLDIDQPFGTATGLCKPPVAAGRGAGDLAYDIVPGHPEQSILSFRMASVEPAIEMPELAKGLVHAEGVALVDEWIRSLEGELRLMETTTATSTPAEGRAATGARELFERLGYASLLALALSVAWAGLAGGLDPALVTGGVALSSLVALGLLEVALPFTPTWRVQPRSFGIDALHSVVAAYVVAPVVRLTVALIGSQVVRATGVTAWPLEAPLLLQLALAVLVADLGAYAAHRFMHSCDLGWRLHAVHHSTPRLNFMASGRTHPFNAVLTFGFETGPLMLLGAPAEVLTLWTVLKATNGLLQHSNVAFRPGWLSQVLVTTEVHRWHHSTDLFESNRNFGNTTVVWDRLFGTLYLPADRRPGTEVGIAGNLIPESYLVHLGVPLLLHRYQPAPSPGPLDASGPA